MQFLTVTFISAFVLNTLYPYFFFLRHLVSLPDIITDNIILQSATLSKYSSILAEAEGGHRKEGIQFT